MGQRQRSEPTDDWQQLDLLVRFPEQRTYELIRPVVLFGYSPAERARLTGAPQRTLYRQAARFEREGMASLFGPPKVERHRTLPEPIQRAILTLKAEHPAFHAHEIAKICGVQFGRRPSHHTVRRILAEDPLPILVGRRFPPYHQITDPATRRHAVLTLHGEGWTVTGIAAYMQVDRHIVYDTLKRWVAEGLPGMADKSHARTDGVRKVDLPAITAIKRLQENPELGAFRMHAALKQQGIELSPRTCGRIMARNRKLYGLARPARTPHTKTPQPFAATRRHQYWSVDIRHLDMANIGMKVYCVSILENYSRAILASGVFPQQDLAAYLMILYTAIRQHGIPETLVSDSGAVFVTAKQAKVIYAALGIEKREIERGKPWQNYIESTFKIQRRMADWHFAKATTWADLLAVHDQWVVNLNYQVHWAHQERDDDRRTPRDVLAWYTGRPVTPAELHRLFYRTRFGRKLDKLGYLRFRHWRVYGERGLARERAAVWLYGETLTLEYADELLAQYRVRYQPDKAHLRNVAEPRLFATPYQSPQLSLWELSDAEWLKIMRRPDYAPRKARQERIAQPTLFVLDAG
ncbi:MAG: helix-turn-helix domain-containing protein [Thermomicrobia bacterium]|nr:helix-turn-helix domain-containing protein [Thermomicrobia bacterium]